MTEDRLRDLLGEYARILFWGALGGMIAGVPLYHFILGWSPPPNTLDASFREILLGVSIEVMTILFIYVISYGLFSKVKAIEAAEAYDRLIKRLAHVIETTVKAILTPSEGSKEAELKERSHNVYRTLAKLIRAAPNEAIKAEELSHLVTLEALTHEDFNTLIRLLDRRQEPQLPMGS